MGSEIGVGDVILSLFSILFYSGWNFGLVGWLVGGWSGGEVPDKIL